MTSLKNTLAIVYACHLYVLTKIKVERSESRGVSPVDGHYWGPFELHVARHLEHEGYGAGQRAALRDA